MEKLKHSIIGSATTLSDEKREEEILYYRDLFRLSFQVYDEDEVTPDNEILDLDYTQVGGFNGMDDDDIQFYRDKFAALGVPEMFYQLCLDYCQDQLAVLKKRAAAYPDLKDLYAKKNTSGSMKRAKSKRHNKYNLLKVKIQRVEDNRRTQNELAAQIVAIKHKLAELGHPVPTEPKKTTVTINSTTPEMEPGIGR